MSTFLFEEKLDDNKVTITLEMSKDEFEKITSFADSVKDRIAAYKKEMLDYCIGELL